MESLELMAKMRFIGEPKFVGHGFIGPALGDQPPGKAAPELTAPLPRRLTKLPGKKTLQVSKGNRAERGHNRRLKISLSCQVLPILYS